MNQEKYLKLSPLYLPRRQAGLTLSKNAVWTELLDLWLLACHNFARKCHNQLFYCELQYL